MSAHATGGAAAVECQAIGGSLCSCAHSRSMIDVSACSYLVGAHLPHGGVSEAAEEHCEPDGEGCVGAAAGGARRHWSKKEPHGAMSSFAHPISLSLLSFSVDKKKSDKKSESSVSDGRVLTKKLGALDEQLKAKNRELSVTKMKSTMFIGVVMIGVFGLLSNLFDGVVVAKLPFEPFALLRNMSHRGLSGSDPTQCSFMLIYMLCQLSVRANVQKLLGLAPATTGPSLFQLPESQ